MLSLLKYTIFILLFLSVGLFYLLSTPLGNQNIYDYIDYRLSKKIDFDIKIKSINIDNYPYAIIELTIEEKAKLTITGYIDTSRVDMRYKLISDCIVTKICKIDDNIDIDGNISGEYSHLNISGSGKALDGNISYSAIKFIDKAEDIKLSMRDINSSKLLILLGQDALIKGKADVDVDFKLMQKDNIEGFFTYNILDNNFSGIPLNLYAMVEIANMKHKFKANISSPYLELNITDGEYKQDIKLANANYVLDIKELSKLESILGYKYLGSFYARGEMRYDKTLKITGLSKSFGGLLDFVFTKEKIKINLDKVSFVDVMSILPYPKMITAEASGEINYNFINKKLEVNTKLEKTKFLPSKLVNIIYQKSGVNMMKESFDNSYLDASYQNNILTGDIEIANDRSHVFITSVKMDADKNTVNAYFDFNMQKQSFSGKIYGSLSEPKVNLDMQKLIKFQMKKQLDAIMGKGPRKGVEKMIDTIPMANVAEGVATEAASSFIGMFF
ncbi:MAG: hypothetical protein QM493_02145 [Sulfurovum sp.]